MADSLQDFYDIIAGELNEAEEYATQIANATRRAVNAVEMQHDLWFMRQEVPITIAKGSKQVLWATVSPTFGELKKVHDWYYSFVEPDAQREEVVHLTKVDSWDRGPVGLGKAEAYVENNIVTQQAAVFSLDKEADEDYNTTMVVYTFVRYENVLPWLIKYAEDLMVAETMIRLAPVIREPALMQMYGQLKTLAEKDLVRLNAEREEAGKSDASQMEYQPT